MDIGQCPLDSVHWTVSIGHCVVKWTRKAMMGQGVDHSWTHGQQRVQASMGVGGLGRCVPPVMDDNPPLAPPNILLTSPVFSTFFLEDAKNVIQKCLRV